MATAVLPPDEAIYVGVFPGLPADGTAAGAACCAFVSALYRMGLICSGGRRRCADR